MPESELDVDDVLLNHNHAPADHTGKVRERWSFRRSNYFEHVGNECRNVMENVGLQDMSPFAKCYVTGPGAEAWLDGLMANRIPKTVGRITLCHMLTKNGGVRSEFTVYRSAPQGFYLVSAGALERHDHDYLTKALPADGSVRMFPVTTRMGRAGARRPALARRAAEADRRRSLEQGVPVADRQARSMSAMPRRTRCASISSASSAGSCIIRSRCRTRSSISLMEAGKEFGIKPFGIRAMMSMAIEKSYRLIGRELSIEYSAYESGLDRFVHPNKGQFLGRDALVQAHADGDKWKFVTMEVRRRHRRRCARLRAALDRRRARRPRDERRLWLAGREVAGARHGAAGARRDRHGAGHPILGERKRATIVGESPTIRRMRGCVPSSAGSPAELAYS